jgi:2-amino-4-hydroxy-6-hydroxymethyldihydropteridine diphosphokinase
LRSKAVYVGIGSNLGDREDNIRRALAALREPGIQVLRHSAIYETAPMIVTNQPWFLNLVVEAKTALFPLQLLHFLKAVEKSLGRKRGISKGPRKIDLDVLLYGRSVIDTPEFTIPHPGMAERRFVLEPLAELAPALRHPLTRQTIRQMLQAESVQGQVTRLWKAGL